MANTYVHSENSAAAADNRYTTAGWLAIAMAAIFPTAMILNWVTGLVGMKAFDHKGPVFGPADLLFFIFTIFSIYVLMQFKKLLNERYQFHDLDVWIPISIWWGVLFQVGSVVIRGIVLLAGIESPLTIGLGFLTFMVIFTVTAGIIDIVVAAKLLRAKGLLGTPITVFAYLTMASGIAELTVVLLPLVAFLLLPAAFVTLGVIFLRQQEEVEFV
jgi:hypothetical protein